MSPTTTATAPTTTVSTASPTSPMSPPWTGFVQTTGDALLLLEAARRGIIPRVTRRLVDGERKMINSGSVFVFDEDESGIKRWTDGFFWSPSRILGNFLIYRETDKKGAASAGSAGGRKGRGKATRDLSDEDTTYSARNRGHQSTDSEEEHPSRKSHSLSRPRDPSSDLALRPDKQRERVLLGSLTNSAKFKPDGLMKKTFSLTINGITQHLISYYRISDVEAGRLRCPSSLPELASLSISPEYLDVTHFRNPPKIEMDADGIPRYRGEADDLDINPDPASLISAKQIPASAPAATLMQRPPLFTQGPRPLNPPPPSTQVDYLSGAVPGGGIMLEPGATNIPAPGPGHRTLSELTAYQLGGTTTMTSIARNGANYASSGPYAAQQQPSPSYATTPIGSPNIPHRQPSGDYMNQRSTPSSATPSPRISKRNVTPPLSSSIALGSDFSGVGSGCLSSNGVANGATQSGPRMIQPASAGPIRGRRRGTSVSSLEDSSPRLGTKGIGADRSSTSVSGVNKNKRTNPYPQIRSRRSPPSGYMTDSPVMQQRPSPAGVVSYSQYNSVPYSATPPPTGSAASSPYTAPAQLPSSASGGGYNYVAAPASSYFSQHHSSPYPSPTPTPAAYFPSSSSYSDSTPSSANTDSAFYGATTTHTAVITPTSTPPHMPYYSPGPTMVAPAGGYGGYGFDEK